MPTPNLGRPRVALQQMSVTLGQPGQGAPAQAPAAPVSSPVWDVVMLELFEYLP